MQKTTEQVLYAPSDLMVFLGCPHASFLDVKALSGERDRSATSKSDELFQQKGLEHEDKYLQSLKADGKSVVEIPKEGNLQERADQTLEAITAGAEVIFQGVFFEAPWRGDADFLVKKDIPSNLGDYSYEVIDTKLSRTAKPIHIMQLCVYSQLLEQIQGVRPAQMHLFMGDKQLHSFELEDFFYYYQRIKDKFERTIGQYLNGEDPGLCPYFNLCKWCSERYASYDSTNHLSAIANIKRSQIDKLRKANVADLATLATSEPETKIPELNREMFTKLRDQATLQHHKATTGENKFVMLPCPVGEGIGRIPTPDPGDLFFDMEGDPLHPDGLEYLFGVYYEANGNKTFKPFWAHDHEQEKQAFQEFMDFVDEHLMHHPHAYIYHYNHYETTALKKLAGRYAVCEEQLDSLLRANKFVDLYQVVREAVRTSAPGYSIKDLETFYMDKREGEVTDAAESIVVYNEWLVTREANLLQQIADYNEDDCISTLKLRDWLLANKPHATEPKVHIKEDRGPRGWEERYAEYEELLHANKSDTPALNQRIFHLLEFNNREAKSQWWSTFARQELFTEDLIDDRECLGGLVLEGTPVEEDRSLLYTYRFPAQEHKLGVGAKPVDIKNLESVGTIKAINDNTATVTIKRSNVQEPLPESFSLGPPSPIDSNIIRDAIYGYADQVITQPEAKHAATDILRRSIPRIRGRKSGDAIVQSDDVIAATYAAVANLDNSYLFIQGPPGAGKTYTSGEVIVKLLQQGNKIGVSANSHKAIHNLLNQIEAVAMRQQVKFSGFKKASRGNPESYFTSKTKLIDNETRTADMYLDRDLFAGTTWAFANSHFAGHQLDYLFIDEAGQLSTANVVAMSQATKNIILVGDQMQLGQPIQGVHPGEAGKSVLEFLLEGKRTIPPERGIFLENTWRMRPSICAFISSAFYEDRLNAHPSTSKRQLHLQNLDLPNEGIVMLPAHHSGCKQKSEEEGRIIKDKYKALLGQQFTDKDGSTRQISVEDILVVTPYNVQVNYLSSILPYKARVGTVDKFQGQEAPIVMISMVSSSAEDMARNIEFLYSKNRINVAISRAQCLAIVVANPNLLEIPCATVEQIRLVNSFCRMAIHAILNAIDD